MTSQTFLLCLLATAFSIGCSGSEPESLEMPEGNAPEDALADEPGIAPGSAAPSVEFIINRDNYQAHLVQAFEIYFGRAYDQRLPSSHMTRLQRGDIVNVREESDGPATTTFATYACSNGGTVEIQSVSGISPLISIGVVTDQCQYREDTITGRFGIGGYRDISHYNISLQDFQVAFGVDDLMTADGKYRRYTGFTSGYGRSPFDRTEHWRTEALDYQISYLGELLSIDDATTLAWYGYTGRQQIGEELFWVYKAHMEGSFAMRTSISSGASVQVSTSEVFAQETLTTYDAELEELQPDEAPSLPAYTSGKLELVAEDGSSLQLQANGLAAGSSDITLTNGEIVESFSISWDTLNSALVLRDRTLEFPAR